MKYICKMLSMGMIIIFLNGCTPKEENTTEAANDQNQDVSTVAVSTTEARENNDAILIPLRQEIITEITNDQIQDVNGIAVRTTEASENDDDIPIPSKPEIQKYLLNIFPDGNYILLPEPLKTADREIWFALHHIKENPTVSDVIVGFSLMGEEINQCLLIKDFQFINADASILYDFSKRYKGIYGFDIGYSYPRVEGYIPGLNIDTYFDEGKRIADNFAIEWNPVTKLFQKVIFLMP